MPGVKGNPGNRTVRRGRKLRSSIELTDRASKHLRKIWKARTLHEPGLTEDEIACAAILALPEPEETTDWDGGIL